MQPFKPLASLLRWVESLPAPVGVGRGVGKARRERVGSGDDVEEKGGGKGWGKRAGERVCGVENACSKDMGSAIKE